jgi:tRNA-modifying protein YgfZ
MAPDSQQHSFDPVGFVAGIDAYGPTVSPPILPNQASATALATAPVGANARATDRPLTACVLAEYGVITVLGPEARPFLNAQSTNDVLKLADDGVQLDGYCTPKGRLLASFVEWPTPEGIHLAVARDLAEPIAKRLAQYVFRAKLKVRDASNDWLGLGLYGRAISNAMVRLGLNLPAYWKLARNERWTALALPHYVGAEQLLEPRIMLWIPTADLSQVKQLLDGLERQDGLVCTWANTDSWRAADIEAGLPRIVKGSAELFVPQMLNFDLIDAVNFKKGCYPGQEIVARSQYLGKLKRRMLKGSTNRLALPGDDILAPRERSASSSSTIGPAGTVDASQSDPVGKVVMAAAKPGDPGRFVMLMELQLAHASNSQLTVGGAPIQIEPLPYPLPVEAPSAKTTVQAT